MAKKCNINLIDFFITDLIINSGGPSPRDNFVRIHGIWAGLVNSQIKYSKPRLSCLYQDETQHVLSAPSKLENKTLSQPAISVTDLWRLT